MPGSMTITPLYAWANAERRIYDYLVEKLGGEDGVTCYLEEYSKHAPPAGEMWTFHIQGGGPGQLVPQPFFEMNAEWRGFYLKRSAAQQAWGRLLAVLPIANGVVEGVIHVRFAGGPELERGTMTANQDGTDVGGEIRGWQVSVPLTVNFQPTEPEITGESNERNN